MEIKQTNGLEARFVQNTVGHPFKNSPAQEMLFPRQLPDCPRRDCENSSPWRFCQPHLAYDQIHILPNPPLPQLPWCITQCKHSQVLFGVPDHSSRQRYDIDPIYSPWEPRKTRREASASRWSTQRRGGSCGLTCSIQKLQTSLLHTTSSVLPQPRRAQNLGTFTQAHLDSTSFI